MNTPSSIFDGDINLLAGIDIDSPLSSAKARTCEYYREPYRNAAVAAEQAGDYQIAAVYRFLLVLVGFHPSFDTPGHPFAPMIQTESKRSPLPIDLSASDIDAIRTLSTQTSDASLRARLHDVLWVLRKDHVAGAEAARQYVASAEILEADGDWTFAVTSYNRGLQLAAQFGRTKPLFIDLGNRLISTTKRAAMDETTFHFYQLMGVLLQRSIGEPSDFAPLASSVARKAMANGDARKARAYWEAEAEWHKLANDFAAAQKARLAAAEAAVVEAEEHARGVGGGFIAAAQLLRDAIESLRREGALPERIAELRRKQNDWQQRSLSEFQPFAAQTDISRLIPAARDHVKDTDFSRAVFKLAFGQSLSDPKQIKDEILRAAREEPLSFLLDAVFVDSQGRTTMRKGGLLNLKGEPFEEALEAEAFFQVSHQYWPHRVDSFIEPARLQILNDHKPTFQDLLFMVRNNPFVPPGHEGIFLRGLHAGFHGDFQVAIHLLVPQIENSLRYFLESSGVDVSNLKSDGTQPVKVLGALLGMTEAKELLGDALWFELRGCLIEKSGFDFRNRVAHGFVSDGECYSVPGITTWWLVLGLCLTPMVKTFTEKEIDKDKSGGENPVAL